MGRNAQLQLLRGTIANIPVLADGEFYFATDQYQLYVGFSGDALPIGAPMAVQVQDGGNTTNKLAVLPDGSIPVTTASASKSPVLKTGQLTTTAITANQTVLTYTVTVGKTFFLEYIDLQGRLTAPSSTASVLGTVTLSVGGAVVYTGTFVNPTTSDAGSQSIRFAIPEPIPLPAGTVILIAVTPASTTSMLWTGNFGGYER